MTQKQITALAKKLGAFYETGAWRFPSVAAKEKFERLVSGAK